MATILLGLYLAVAPVSAAVFIVNSADDTDDASCDVSHCSLREAIAAANAAAGPDEIDFAIPGPGPHIIDVLSALPTVTQPLTIDGYTQLGATPNTRTAEQGDNNAVLQIVIRSDGSVDNGFHVSSPGFVLRGVCLGGFSYLGLLMDSSFSAVANAHHVEGNYFGLMPDGMTPILPSMRIGMYSSGPITLGGTSPAARNVIAGFGENGFQSGTQYVVIEGNIIGMDASAVSNLVIDNFATAVHLTSNNAADAPEMRIGGSLPGQGNRIASRNGDGIDVVCGPPSPCYDGLLIQGNTINVDLLGQSFAYATFDRALQFRVSDAGRIQVGGTGPGEGNLLGSTSYYGTVILPYSGVATFGNVALQGNRLVDMNKLPNFLPLRLTDYSGYNNSPLVDDPDDADVGPNGMQNKPVITSLTWDETSVIVEYHVDSAPANSDYPLTVEFAQRAGQGLPGMTGNHYFDTYALADAQQTRMLVIPMKAGEILPLQAIATSASGGSSELTPQIFGIAVFKDGVE